MERPPELTLDEVRQRARVAGVTIAENRLEMVRRLLGDALVHVRALDARAMNTVEPAVRFSAAGEPRHE